MNDTITIRSSLSSHLLKKSLFKGSLIAFLGLSILFYAGIKVDLQDLNIFGMPILILSFSLMTWGMYPYRNLSQIQLHPHRFQMDEKALNYSKGKKLSLKIPLNSIQKIYYLEKGRHYGLAIQLKNPLPKKLCVLERKLDMHRLRKHSIKHYSCDLFFPYFTEQAIQKLTD